MTRHTIVLWTGAVALLILPLPPVAAHRQTAAPPQAITEFDVNGLKVLVKQRTGSPTATAALFIRGGAHNVTAENAGVEALMLSVATEASTNFPREKFRRELSRTGTVIGSGINNDYSALTLGCTHEYFDRAWSLFVDAALRPSFAPDDFERVKNQYLLALSSDEDTPDSSLANLTARVIYAGHPYANDPHGTVDSVKKLTVADMKRFHDEMMQTSRLLLVVVGDLDPQDIKRKVEASFSTLAKGAYVASPTPPLSFPAPTVNVTDKDLPTHYVQGTYAAPPPASADMYPLRVGTSILRDRIFNEVRVRRALSYAPDAFLNTQSANTGGIYVTAVDANQAVFVMLNEVAKLRTIEVSPDEITATAQQFLTNYYIGQETNAAQAGSLAQAELIGGGWKNAGEFIDRVRAVTPQDVRRVANKYMRSLQFVVLGNAKDIDKQIFLQQGLPPLEPSGLVFRK